MAEKALAGDAFDRAFVEIGGYLVPGTIVDEFGEIDLAHHGGHDMAVLQMEVVVGAIQVRRHHGYIIGAVLQVVALAHLQAGNLCNGILLVGVFQRAGQQAVFLHRLRCILGIDTGATQEEEFLYAMGVCFADDIALNLHVHHDEVCPIEHIGHDAAYEGCGQHNGIGLFFIEELPDCYLVCQVQFFVAAANKVIISPTLQIIPYC